MQEMSAMHMQMKLKIVNVDHKRRREMYPKISWQPQPEHESSEGTRVLLERARSWSLKRIFSPCAG